MNEKECDIIIPVFNNLDVTKKCLRSIYASTNSSFILILIDNGSDPETRGFLEDFSNANKNVKLIKNNDNLGWVKAVNQGMRLSVSPYICIMNNDTVVRTTGWLSSLIGLAEEYRDIGLVNPRFDIKKNMAHTRHFVEMDFARGHCLLVKREVMDKIGVLDEAFGMGYNDDDDFSIRAIRAGYRCVMASNVIVEHRRSTTFTGIFEAKNINAMQEKNKALLRSKWGRRLRIVFIVTRIADKYRLSELLFLLARRQHIIYLWNTKSLLMLAHTNIIEKYFPVVLIGPISRLLLYLNKKKNKPKHYDLVYIDNADLKIAPPDETYHIYNLDPVTERDQIVKIADFLSRA